MLSPLKNTSPVGIFIMVGVVDQPNVRADIAESGKIVVAGDAYPIILALFAGRRDRSGQYRARRPRQSLAEHAKLSQHPGHVIPKLGENDSSRPYRVPICNETANHADERKEHYLRAPAGLCADCEGVTCSSIVVTALVDHSIGCLVLIPVHLT